MDKKKIFLYFRQTDIDTEHGQYQGFGVTNGDDPASICIPVDSIRMISAGDHQGTDDDRITIYFDSIHNFKGANNQADEHVTTDRVVLNILTSGSGADAITYQKAFMFGLMSAIEGAKSDPTHNGFITVFDAADSKSNLYIPVKDATLANAGLPNNMKNVIRSIHEIKLATPVTGS